MGQRRRAYPKLSQRLSNHGVHVLPNPLCTKRRDWQAYYISKWLEREAVYANHSAI